MPLPDSGQISLDDVRAHLGLSTGTRIGLSDAQTYNITTKYSPNAISLYDCYNTAPGDVDIITVSNITPNSATLTWSDVTNTQNDEITYYIFYAAYGDPFSAFPNHTTTNTTVDLTGLDQNTQYNIKIVANDGSLYSNDAIFQQLFRTKSLITVDRLSFYSHGEGNNIGQFQWYILHNNYSEIKSISSSTSGSSTGWVLWSNYTDAASDIIPPYCFAIRYQNGTSGTSYQGDFALDRIWKGSTLIANWEASSTGWKTSASSTSNGLTAYDNSSDVSSTETGLRWVRKNGSTSSGSTGPSSAQEGSYYVYAETSSPAAAGDYFWLFSPEQTS